MKPFHYPQLAETIYRGILENGLQIVVIPRSGFTKKLAYFVTDYGSIHTDFSLNGQSHQAPAGVAHFLEHKLFDMPGRDITREFAALGATPNAFTSYDMTAYYFSCTEHFEENLKLLLEFVTTPYFTQETVDKEQGIIGQEIDMNLDAPDSRIFENLMTAMYRQHPIRVDVLGTLESIGRITPQDLYDCHRAFYHPGNMLLCAVGDVDPEEILQIAEEKLGGIPAPAVEQSRQWPEEMTCEESYRMEKMEVAMPMFQIGFKCEPLDKGFEAICREITGDLAAEALFGEASELYLRLYEEGLIDSAFGGGFETVDGMAMLTISGDSDDPEAVRDAILAQARKIAGSGISDRDFQRMKRSAMGRRIRDLDSFSSTCFRMCAYYFSGFDYFEFPKVYETVTAEGVREFIDRVVTEERCALSVIEPIEEEYYESQ